MFGTRHSVTVRSDFRGRGYQYSCSCGATGFITPSPSRARQMGEQHKASKTGNHR